MAVVKSKPHLVSSFQTPDIFIVLFSVLSCWPTRETNCSNSNVSFGMRASEKAYHNQLFRRFAFPPGTFLIFVPEVTLPTWRDYPLSEDRYHQRSYRTDSSICDAGNGAYSSNVFAGKVHTGATKKEDNVAAVKNAAIQISSPFYVYFDKLGWTHEDSIYNTPSQVASYIQEYLVNPTLHIFGVPPPSPSNETPKVTKKQDIKKPPTTLSLSDYHRLQVFLKIENLLEKFGAENGRACLLRTICELNEFPFATGRFGIFGEILTLVLSSSSVIDETIKPFAEKTTNPCLNVYSRAEKYGKVKDCTSYAKYCSHSVFHWYWKMNRL